MDFLQENWQTLLPLVTFVIGWLLPNAKIRLFGEKVGEKIPTSLRKVIADKLDAFEKGLLDADVDGNKEVTHNDTIKSLARGIKIDLGLD